MVSPERSRSMGETTTTMTTTSPRISFSAEFMDDDSFISISPGSSLDKDDQIEIEREIVKNAAAEFEFLSGKNSLDAGHSTMLTADELFFEGKLLPYWQINHAAEKLTRINLKSSSPDEDDNPSNTTTRESSGKMKLKNNNITTTTSSRDQQANASAIMLGRDQQEPRIWFVDDDPSPRPPKCTVLWKELLRLKKTRSSTLSPSSSSSSSSSSSRSLGDAAAMEEKEKEKESGLSTREKHIKRIKKGLERTRSASMRIRPMVNVPICTQSGKSSSLPPLFPLKKNKIDR